MDNHKITTPFINLKLAKQIINQFAQKFGIFSETQSEYLTPKLPKVPRFSEQQEKEYQFPGSTQDKEEKIDTYTKTLKNQL